MDFVLRNGKHALIVLIMIICCIPVVGFSQSYQLTAKNDKDSQTVVVNHKIKGSNVYVECLIPNFTFDDAKSSSKHKGYIEVYVDEKKYQTEHKAVFIIENLSEGKHVVRLDIMRPDGGRYISLKEIDVKIK